MDQKIPSKEGKAASKCNQCEKRGHSVLVLFSFRESNTRVILSTIVRENKKTDNLFFAVLI